MLLYLLLIKEIFTVILLHVIRYYPTLGKGVGSGAHKSCKISETMQYRIKVTITD